MKAVLHNKYFWLILLLHIITAEGKAQSSFIKKLPLRGVPAKMIATSDGGYACLAATDFVNFQFNKISLIKCDANGDTLWVKKYALNDSSVYFPKTLIEIPGIGFCFVSIFYQKPYPNAGNGIVYFTNFNGDELWSKDFFDSSSSAISNHYSDLITLSNNSLAVLGGLFPYKYLHELDFSGTLINVNMIDTFGYTYSHLLLDSNNVPLISRVTPHPVYNHQNIYTSNSSLAHFNDHYYTNLKGLYSAINKIDNAPAYLSEKGDTIIKLDNNLDSLWAHTVTNYYTAGFTSQLPKDFKATADGGYVLCGNISNVVADLVFLLKTDSLANTVFKQIYFGAMADNVVSVEQAADGGFVMLQSGNADSTNVPEMWLVKTDSTGVLTNVKNPALQPAQPDFTLSPNPAGSYTQLVFNKAVTGKVTVYDLAGKALFTAEIKNKPTFRLKLDSCNSGLYIIRFMPKSGLPVSKKLII